MATKERQFQYGSSDQLCQMILVFLEYDAGAADDFRDVKAQRAPNSPVQKHVQRSGNQTTWPTSRNAA